MKRILFLTLSFGIISFSATSQDTSVEKELTKKSELTEEGWTKGGLFATNFSQVSLTNWVGGGTNSIALNALLNLHANLKKGDMTWENSLTLGYGITKLGDADFFKSDDRIELTSKYGRKAFGDWSYAGLINFRSQMFDGFATPTDTARISTFLAPGYLLGALGLDYKPNANFSAFIAPVTGKITFVMDDDLAAVGAFGVDAGENIRTEFGGYVRLAYVNDELLENVSFTTKLDLFSNYLNNPENIDVNWETIIGLKVNKFITASLSTLLIYDDDIDITETDAAGAITGFGPRTQFKQVFGVGLSYKF